MFAGGVNRRLKVVSTATALEGRHSPCGGLDPVRTVSAFQACGVIAFGIRALTGPASTLSARWALHAEGVRLLTDSCDGPRVIALSIRLMKCWVIRRAMAKMCRYQCPKGG